MNIRNPRQDRREIPHKLAGIELVTDEGAPVTTGSAWSARPALLVFIRHFG